MKLSEYEMPEWLMCVLGLAGAVAILGILLVVYYFVEVMGS
jgi:CHASE1-domain containing sensor protein